MYIYRGSSSPVGRGHTDLTDLTDYFFQMTVISMTALLARTKVDIYWKNLKNCS